VKLPLLISVPHAGLKIPPEVEGLCLLTPEQIKSDSDEGARTIYALESVVTAFLAGDVARAFVDLNRAEDDRGADGVVKIRTCRKVRIYRSPLSETVVELLLARHYRPYHSKLTKLAKKARLGIDCHTMAEFGPPVGPDPGRRRPHVCLSDAGGTCPKTWLRHLAACLQEAFVTGISLNAPFKGGHIIRSHACELPWVQIELSRAPFLPEEEKRERLLQALTAFCRTVFPGSPCPRGVSDRKTPYKPAQ
jgi:N-formylglutamate amidohydrolase